MKTLGYGKSYSYNPDYKHPVHNVSDLVATDPCAKKVLIRSGPAGIPSGRTARAVHLWFRKPLTIRSRL